VHHLVPDLVAGWLLELHHLRDEDLILELLHRLSSLSLRFDGGGRRRLNLGRRRRFRLRCVSCFGLGNGHRLDGISFGGGLSLRGR